MGETHIVCVDLFYCRFCAGGEWGSLDLVRHRSHLGARGVQRIKRLLKDRLTPCCYVGCTEVRAKSLGSVDN
jgi:hypothetical protein